MPPLKLAKADSRTFADSNIYAINVLPPSKLTALATNTLITCLVCHTHVAPEVTRIDGIHAPFYWKYQQMLAKFRERLAHGRPMESQRFPNLFLSREDTVTNDPQRHRQTEPREFFSTAWATIG